MRKRRGVHLIADLRGCRNLAKIQWSAVLKMTKKLVAAHSLQFLTETHWQFPNGGFTGVIVLSESHISFHTWPERGVVNLDVFVCNFQRNNEKAAQNIFNRLVTLFQPTAIHRWQINRV